MDKVKVRSYDKEFKVIAILPPYDIFGKNIIWACNYG